MNVQCVLCKEIVDIGEFRSSERGIEITCGACGGTYSVESRAAAPAREAGPGEVGCPKCDEPTPDDAAACPRCGLTRERFDGFESAQDGDAPEALAELWEACRDAWDDPAAHDRFLESAMVAQAYRYAAGKYRQALRDDPGDEVARSRLDDVARRAETAILQSAAAARYDDDEKEPYRAVALLLAALIAIIAMGVVYAMFVRGQ